MYSLYCSKRIQDPIEVISFIRYSDRSDLVRKPQETGSGKGTESGNSQFLLLDILVLTFNS